MRLEKMKGPPILLDTNVASYILSGVGLASRYESLIAGWDAHVALTTVAEMMHGAHRRRWGAHRLTRLRQYLESLEWVSPTPLMAHVAGLLMADRHAVGRPLEWNDAWIAATALICGCPLVTHDSDFGDIEGLYVISALSPLRVCDGGSHGASRLPARYRWLELAA